MYGPNLNLVRDPRWGRAQEVYSEDPELTSALTVGCVSGIQAGKGLDDAEPEPMLAAACCKHFAAYNVETIPTDRYHFDANVSTSTDLLFLGTCRRRTLTAGADLQLKRTHLILSDATLGSLGVRRWHVVKKTSALGPRDFWEHYLPAFHACIVKGKAATAMCSYDALNSRFCRRHADGGTPRATTDPRTAWTKYAFKCLQIGTGPWRSPSACSR